VDWVTDIVSLLHLIASPDKASISPRIELPVKF